MVNAVAVCCSVGRWLCWRWCVVQLGWVLLEVVCERSGEEFVCDGVKYDLSWRCSMVLLRLVPILVVALGCTVGVEGGKQQDSLGVE